MTRGLVLLHGFTGAPRSWEGARGALATSAPILAPALLGHGAEGEAAPDFDAEVDRLAAAARRWGQRSPHLVGYSLGARLGLGLLVRHPGLFESATLIGVNPGLESEVAREERREADAAWARLLRVEGLSAFVDGWEALPLFATQASLAKARLEAQRATRLAHDAEGLALSLERLGLGAMPSLWEQARGIEAEVRLLVGGEDAKFRALGERLSSLIPRAGLDVVPGAGHNLPLERPDAVAEIIERTIGSGEKP